jgi:hypothetical protein
MPVPEAPGERAPWLGPRLPFEMLTAPAQAFRHIVAHPEWLSAYALVLAAGLIELVLIAPASGHLKAILPPPDGMAGTSPAEIKSQLSVFFADQAIDQAVAPLFAIGLSATVMTTVARFKGTPTPFNVFVALAANCLIPTALGSLLSGGVAALRPAASYHDFRALAIALPDNLAVFANPAHTSESLFLAGFDPFTLWAAILLAYGFAAVVPVKFVTALALSFALTFVFSVLF